jgi:hypothetical protein
MRSPSVYGIMFGGRGTRLGEDSFSLEALGVETADIFG